MTTTYSLTHLSDQTLLSDLAALIARDRATTAALLAHIAEVDARRLYLPAAYPSMHEYCVHELHLCEHAAFKRIRAARAAREFPAIFAAVAEGRLHLSGVLLLAPYLTPERADELLAAGAHKSRAELERFLAERFPRPDLPGRPRALSAAPLTDTGQLSPGTLESRPPGEHQLAPGRVQAPVRPKLAPLSPGRFALQVTIGQATYQKLRRAQGLLGHSLPSGDLAQVLDRALDALIEKLERRKCAATRRPRRSRRASADPRHIPASVKRAVWKRDGGRCTFSSDTGQRCPARTRLEFDHADPVARGGEATVGSIRLRCRAHNQYAAECTFGTKFMEEKRAAARARALARASAAMSAARLAPGRVERAATEQSDERDVIPWLLQLGFRADEARRAAAWCHTLPEAPLEERVRLALSRLAPPHRRVESGRLAAT